MSATEGVRRLANILLVGHGGALLVIFNARVQETAIAASLLHFVALVFAAGLIAAFLLHYVAYRDDVLKNHNAPFTTPKVLAEALQARASRENWLGVWFMVSSAAFVIGLLVSINSLQPPREAEERPPAEIATPTAPQR